MIKKIKISLLIVLIALLRAELAHSQIVNLLTENFSSNSYTTNGWTFPNGQSNWLIGSSNTPSGGVAPNAYFNWAPTITNYSVSMVSNTINALAITGPVTMNYLLLLNNFSSATLEQFKVEYKTLSSPTWTILASYNNTLLGIQNWSVSGVPLIGTSGTNFQIRFTAFGLNSFNLVRWSLDNILVQGISCPAVIPALTVTASSPTMCSGNSVTLTSIGGGISYTWTPIGGNTSTAVVSPTSTSAFALISSVPGCTAAPVTAITTISVFSNSTTLTAVASATSICSGNSLTLAAGGASSYSWNPGSVGALIVVSPTASVIYTVTSTNSIGCTNSATLGVNVNPNPQISVFSSTPIICPGGFATLVASGANTYTWSNGSSGAIITASPSVTTIYTVTGNNGLNCPGISTLILNVSPHVLALSTHSALCTGATATLTATNGLTYTWSTNANTSSIVILPTLSATYSVSATNSAGCVSSQTLTITVNPNPTVSATSSASFICTGTNATLTAFGASTYSWSNGGTGSIIAVSPSVNTSYAVSGISSAGCSGINNSSTVSLIVKPSPTVTAISSSSLVCSGDTVTFTASGGDTYSWSTGAAGPVVTVVAVPAATYFVVGTNTLSCSNNASVNLTVLPSPTVSVFSTVPLVCNGESATLTAIGAGSYLWSNNSTDSNIIVTPSQTSDYTVTGTAQNGCSNSAVITLSVDACSGLIDKKVQINLSFVYPNPSNGLFNINLEDITWYDNMEIYNYLGQIIISIKPIIGNTQVNIVNYPSGVYYLRLKSRDRYLETIKIIKE